MVLIVSIFGRCAGLFISMAAKRPHFNVGAMMKARKELQEKIVFEHESITEKKVCLHNLQKTELRLDSKVSCPMVIIIIWYITMIIC